jgi:hypothetical protein
MREAGADQGSAIAIQLVVVHNVVGVGGGSRRGVGRGHGCDASATVGAARTPLLTRGLAWQTGVADGTPPGY